MASSPASVMFFMCYFVFCTGFIFRFKEFVSIGLTPENLLSSFIKCSEDVKFLEFHLRKTAGTLVLYSLLPLGFILGFVYTSIHVDQTYPTFAKLLQQMPQGEFFLTLTVMLPITALLLVYFWSLDNWSRHPFVAKILPYARNGLWRDVCGDINTEFRRIDKFTIGSTPTQKIVVTDNWVIMMGHLAWNFQIAHQSDIYVSLVHSEQHNISTEGEIGGSQFLTIHVQNRRIPKNSFTFRLNSLDYQNLADKLRASVNNVKNIQIYKTVSEQFVEVFRDEVARNPTVRPEGDLEPCIGCMAINANVKLVRRCGDQDGAGNTCVNCYCRPMWCINCLATWFASRQNQQQPQTWLGSKCPCPTCRSKFCLLDVAMIMTDS